MYCCLKPLFLQEVDGEHKTLLTEEKIRTITSLIPDDWLVWEGMEQSPAQIREVYIQFLLVRLANSQLFINQANDARQALI